MTSVCVSLRKTWGSVHVPVVLVPVTLWGVWCRAGCPSEWRSWMRLEPVWRCETMSECFSGWTPRPSPAFDCHLAGTWPQGCFRIPPGRDISHPRRVCCEYCHTFGSGEHGRGQLTLLRLYVAQGEPAWITVGHHRHNVVRPWQVTRGGRRLQHG